MASIFHPSTPPPPSSIHVPPTPKHGWEDDYQPYTPRKSARVSSQRARVAQTPPPHYSSRSMKKTSSTNTTSPPSSPQTASKKKAPKAPSMMGGRSVSGALNDDTTVSAAEALGLSKAHDQRKMDSNQSATVRRVGMLPTPAKTPKKQPTEISSGITSIARNLFPVRPETVEEVMPTPKRKGRKKYTGFSLDSFEAEDDGASIQIYTDSHERVPEVDCSSDNPFYGDASNAQPEPTKRASKRRKIPVPGEEDQTIEEAEKREDGLIYVFRGKKTFRKFVDDDDSGSDGDASDADVGATLGTTVPERLRRPLTRSSIKPRLLFPTPEQSKAKEKRSQLTEDEEEAVTDIEEQADITSTPLDQTDEVIMTPKAPKFAPASPPTTARATRSTNKLESDDEHPPMRNGRARGGKVSPFDGWSRTKTVSGQGKKREGEPLSRTGGESSKRLRS